MQFLKTAGSSDAESSAFPSQQQPCAACGETASSQTTVAPAESITQLLLQNCSQHQSDPGAAAAAVSAPLHMTGCSNCCTHRGRSWQDEAAAAGVVEQLAAALAGQQHTAEQQTPEQMQPINCTQALAEDLQALLFVCCEHAGNVQRLLQADGLQLLLKQSAAAAADADALQLWCLMLGIAADAAAPADNNGPQQEQLVASLLALKRVAQQQLTAAVATGGSSSSNFQQHPATTVLWAISKLAQCLARHGRLASSSNSSSECQHILHSVLADVVLPYLAAAVQAEAAVCDAAESAQQEQPLLFLTQQCVACCAVLAPAVWTVGAVGAKSTQQLHVLLPAVVEHCTQVTSSDSSSVSNMAAQVRESAGTLLRWLSQSGIPSTIDTANSSDQPRLQHVLPVVQQHMPACRVLAGLRQQHKKLRDSSNGAIEPLVQDVVAGATATIEVVYAGSQAGKDSCDEKDSTPSSKGRCSDHGNDTCLLGGTDAPAVACVRGQQLELHDAAAGRQQQGRREQQHEQCAADQLFADTYQPPHQQQVQSHPLVLDPVEGDRAVEQCSVPHRSSSSCSIKACGDSKTDNSSSSYGSGSSNSDGDHGGSDRHDQAGGGGDGDATGNGSGNSGAPTGSGGGNSGSSGGDDDRKDDHKQHNKMTPAAESGDTAADSTEAGNPSSSAATDSVPAATVPVAAASSGVGCSARDPVVVPAPAAVGTGQGLQLYGRPASRLAASAAAAGQCRANESGALYGSNLGPAALMGTGLQGTARLSGLLSPSGPLTTPGTPLGGHLGTLSDIGNVSSTTPAFAFPAHLSQLTVPPQPQVGGGSLAEALLSPMSLAGRSMQQNSKVGELDTPTTPAGLGSGFPGFRVANSPLAGVVPAAAYRRASESSGVGGALSSRYSSSGGGWGSLRAHNPQQQRQLAFHQQLQQQHGDGMLPGSWPNAAPGAGITALEQHHKQLQQPQGLAATAAADAGLPPLMPAAAAGHHVASAARPPCAAASPSLLSPAASGGHAAALGSVGSGSSSICMPMEHTALSGQLSSHLHMLNPGLMGLIGSSDPNLGALGTQLSGQEHLMTWLSHEEYTRAGTFSASSSGVISAASAAAVVESDAAAMAQTAAALSSLATAATAAQKLGGTDADVKAELQQKVEETELEGSSCSHLVTATDTSQTRTRDQGLLPPAAPPSCKATDSSCGPATGTASSEANAQGGAAAARTPAAATLLRVASISSGSSISRAGSMGSAGGSMAHSFSGDSLGSDADLEAMRLSSASFAAALAEAEAIAANVAASMARQQQDVAAAKSDQGAGAQATAGVPGQAESGDAAASPQLEASGTAYDPAELTKGQPSRHLWLGNLHQRLPRSVLRGVFERYGPVDDVVTFPGRMYAFVNFKEPADAAKAAEAVQDKEVPVLSGARRLLVKFRPSRRALGKVAEAMVPGLVEPGRSASNSSTSSNTGSSASSASGSQSNLEAAAAAPSATVARGPHAGAVTASRSSSSSLAWLTAAAASGGANTGARPASEAAAAAVEPDGSSAAGADSSLATVRSVGGEGLKQQQQLHLPPGLSAATTVAAAPGSAAAEEAPDTTAAPDQGLQLTGSGSLAAAAGPSSMSSAAAAAAAVAAAAAAVANSSTDSNAATAAHVAAAAAALAAVDAGLPQGPTAGSGDASGIDDGDIPEGKPSRHLWLGNIPLKPNRAAMEALFSRFGPLESVRVFPGKTFAFVNFVHAAHALQAKAALDAQPSPHITGPKPLVIRFQKDTAAIPLPGTAARAFDLAAARARKVSVPRTSLTGGLLGSSATGSLGALGVDEELLVPEPAVNLSNKLNPNNIHYDRELAARYKRMTKTEKEALWAQDRALQQLEHNPAAASLLSAAAAAAAAAAAGQHTPGMMFDHTLHQHQGRAAAAAAAASSIYGQLMSANPQLAAAATALAQAQAHGGANAAAAAGLFQQAQAAGMEGAAAWSTPASSVYQHMAAAFNASMAPNSAAAAHMAASGLDSFMGRLGGFGGSSAGQFGAAAGLQQYLAAAGALHNPLTGQANQAALLQQLGGSSYPMPGQHDTHVAAAAAALQMSGACDPAALAALGLDPSMFQSPMGSGLPPHMSGVGLAGMDAGQQAAARASAAGGAGNLSPLLSGGGFAAGSTAGLGHASTPHAGAVPRRSYPGAAPGSWDLGGGDSAGVSDFEGVGDGSGRSQIGVRASTTGAGLLGSGTRGSQVGGLGPIGPSSASSAATRDAMAAAVASAFGDLGGQQRQYGQQEYSSQPQQVALAGWGGVAGQGTAGGGGRQWPPHLLCPLTKQVLSEPVMAADGHTYERTAIVEWLRLRDVSPVTGQPLSSAALQPNHQIRQAIGAELMKMQGGGGLL